MFAMGGNHRSDSRERPRPKGANDSAEVHATVRGQLERHDHRYTRGRRRLVEALLRAARPVTLPEIAAENEQLPQSSAYRNLDVLERSGVIRRIARGSDHAFFELAEPFVDHHHHLVCLDCGSVTDMHLDDDLEQQLDARLAQVADGVGFRPVHHSLELHGHCLDCRPTS